MQLQEIVDSQLNIGLEAIAKDKELSLQVQVLLIGFGLLEPPADGKFGPVSADALRQFTRKINSPELDFIGPMTAITLLQDDIKQYLKAEIKLGWDLPSRVVTYMFKKNYFVSAKPQELNIIYIEGMKEDYTLNNDAPDEFNDLRMLLGFVNGYPKVFGQWQATTEPGEHYTVNPMNPDGAARIKFGQYKAWAVGMHGNAEPHEALVQVKPITVCRDLNKDFKRTGDKEQTGLFAINQHWGYDYPANQIHNASAGCLVGRTRAGHREFMKLLKTDRRYLVNNNYTFITTIIPGDDLLKIIF